MKAFQSFLAKHFPQGNTGIWILGFSGGVDSVVLAHLMKQQGIAMQLLHVNFQLRGSQSDADELFVRKVANEWNLPLEVARVDTTTYAEQHKCSIQVAARELRYQWFYKWLAGYTDQNKKAFIVTAHHGNDAVETMLINLMRGTGIEGLHGILPVKENLIRPLTGATKNELLAYAATQSLVWAEDASNSETYYTRNAIRHKIIPVAEELFPAAVQNMMATIEKMQEAEMLFSQAMEWHKKRLLRQVKDEWHIPVLLLQQSQPVKTILWQLLKPFGYVEGQVPEVLKLCSADSGAYVPAKSWRIIRHGRWLILAKQATTAAQTFLIEGGQGAVQTPDGTLQWKTTAATSLEQLKLLPRQEVFIQAKNLKFPILLRQWKAGDYLYPLGMAKKKKVSRVLIDLKLSKTAKEKVWVLESHKKIIWIAGLRLDERFKIEQAGEPSIHLVWKDEG